jgi:hypothetical protein
MKTAFLFFTLILTNCANFEWIRAKPQNIIILDFLPNPESCELIKDFTVNAKSYKLAQAIKYGRNEAKIKTSNLGGNYLFVKKAYVDHHRFVDIFKRDQFEFTVEGKAFNCTSRVKRLYKALRKKGKFPLPSILILEKHSPVPHYCQYAGAIYINSTPKEYKEEKILKKIIQNHIRHNSLKLGGNTVKPDMIQFSAYTGEYVVYAKSYRCTKKYVEFLRNLENKK